VSGSCSSVSNPSDLKTAFVHLARHSTIRRRMTRTAHNRPCGSFGTVCTNTHPMSMPQIPMLFRTYSRRRSTNPPQPDGRPVQKSFVDAIELCWEYRRKSPAEPTQQWFAFFPSRTARTRQVLGEKGESHRVSSDEGLLPGMSMSRRGGRRGTDFGNVCPSPSPPLLMGSSCERQPMLMR
jgi:hypothetical protein